MDKLKEEKELKILELFSGYGTATFALKRLGIPHRLVGYSDIDKWANQVFKQNHCPNDTEDKLRLGDVTKINPHDLEDFNLLTGGFCCQSYSQAGLMKGEADPRGTVFYDIIRIAEVKQPRFMLLENVKGLTSKRFTDTFNKMLSELDRIGYKVHWRVLNTADYGIPQSRNRIWFVCFREQEDYDSFKWPEKEELKIFIKDILEEEVDEKYYLSDKLQERFRSYLEEKNKKDLALLNPYNKRVDDKVSGTIGTSCGTSTGKTAQIVAMRSYSRTGTKEVDGERTQNFESNEKGISNSLTTVQKDNLVAEKKFYSVIPNHPNPAYYQLNEKGNHSQQDRYYFTERTSPTLATGNPVKVLPDEMEISLKDIFPEQKIARCLKVGGRETQPERYFERKTDNLVVGTSVISNMSPREVGFKEVSPTLLARDYKDPKIVSTTITTAVGRGGHSKEELKWIDNNYLSGKLRRLTPKECFRLQGFLSDEVDISSVSNAQAYKLAGNGQSVNVVEKIFRNMFVNWVGKKK